MKLTVASVVALTLFVCSTAGCKKTDDASAGGAADSNPAVTTGPGKPLRTNSTGASTGKEFEQVAGKGGVLVGMVFTVGDWAGHKVINSVTPVFLIDGEKSMGVLRGQRTSTKVSAIAKPGYAVGGIVAHSGNRLDGLKIIFMRRQGDRLDPKDSYESDWIGGMGGVEHELGCDGKRVVGIFGRAGVQVDALGLVQE